MQRQKDSVNLMTFIKPHQSGFLLSIILAVISVTSGIVPYFAVARIVNLLIGGETNFSTYLTWGIVALIAYLMKSVFHGLSTRCSHEATFHVLSEIRQAVADKLTRVSMGYLTNTPSGRLKTTMVERVEQMEVPLAHIIPEMTSNLLVPIAIIIYLFVLDWRMALVSLITIPIGMLCYMAQMKEYPKKYGAVVQASKYMSATTVEYINGIEVIKAFNQSAASYGKFTQAVRQSVDLMLDWMKSTQGYSALMMTIWPAVLIGVLPVGCLFYMKASAVPERAKHGPLPSGMAPRLPIFCTSRSIVVMFSWCLISPESVLPDFFPEQNLHNKIPEVRKLPNPDNCSGVC